MGTPGSSRGCQQALPAAQRLVLVNPPTPGGTPTALPLWLPIQVALAGS
jgi:hypothetical protein